MKIKNNSVKGALVSLSLATVMGGWAFFGLNDRRQALAGIDQADDLPDTVPATDEAVNYVPMVETVPVSDLLTVGFEFDEEILDLDLEPIPEVVKRDRKAGLKHPPVIRSLYLSGLTSTTSKIVSGNGAQASQPLGSTGATSPGLISSGSAISTGSTAPSPAFDTLPPLPSMPTFDQTQLSSPLALPPIPTVNKQPQQPKPKVRTQSSR